MTDEGAVWPRRPPLDAVRPGGVSPTRILVVEDDPQQADILAAILSDAGFGVTAARDGLQALYQLHCVAFLYQAAGSVAIGHRAAPRPRPEARNGQPDRRGDRAGGLLRNLCL